MATRSFGSTVLGDVSLRAGRSNRNGPLNSLINSLRYVPTYNRRMADERVSEVQTNQQQRADYTKESAFADAQGLIQQLVRQGMEGNMAQLTRSAEGAGASQGALRALMAQDIIARTAENAASAGLNAAVQYGNVSNNFSNVIEALTRPDTGSLNALVSALTAGRTSSAGSGGRGSSNRRPVQAGYSSGSIGNSGSVGASDSRGRVTAVVAAGGASNSGSRDNSAFFNRPGGILSNAADTSGMAVPSMDSGILSSLLLRDRSVNDPISGFNPNTQLTNLLQGGLQF